MKSFNKLITVTARSGKYSGAKQIDLQKYVADGQHLMVEYVSTSSEMPAGQRPGVAIVVAYVSNSVDAGSAIVQHYPVLHFQQHYAGSDIHRSSDRVYMRLSRDRVLRFVMTRDSSKGTARCFVGVSGYIDK